MMIKRTKPSDDDDEVDVDALKHDVYSVAIKK